MNKADITPAVAARLIAAQFRQWAHLPIVPVKIDGWDNTTFRLGDELLIRLPSADAYAPQVEKEQRWLPVLARQLSVRIPEPVARGQPSNDFPRPWSIYRWIEGEPACVDRVAGLTLFAADLARFLVELQAIRTEDAPPAGAHSFFRGGPLDTYDDHTTSAIQLLRDEIDADGATEIWRVALTSKWSQPPVWVHGDIAPSNLLVAGGRLCAVIDFGCSAVGDPACDLVMAWTFFDDESREVFRRALPLDEGTWQRARGWALWKALMTLANEKRGGTPADKAAERAGWRKSASEITDLVIAEHRASNGG